MSAANELKLSGTLTALVTPWTKDGSSVDEAALEKLVEDQIAGGIRGLVPVGTTGESPTLSATEQRTVIERVVKTANGRVPVIAGTGSNSTQRSVDASRAALEAGANAVMIVMPYYNKPSQAGMREHVKQIAAAVDCPIVLYNIPGRSVVDLAADTTAALCEDCPNVVALKDATGNILRAQELKRRLGDRLTVLSGDDGLTLGMMSVGASGVISVSSNVRPRLVSRVTELALGGEWDKARAAHFALLDLHAAMFLEPNPAPAKAALHAEGKMNDTVRGPLVVATAETRAHVSEVLSKLDGSQQ